MEAKAKAKVPGGRSTNPNGKRLRLQEKTAFKKSLANVKKRKVEKKKKSDSKMNFSFFRDDAEARAAGYMYRRMWVADVPMLMEDRGLIMVQALGLEEFSRMAIPKLNKPLCDEFISTYNTKTRTGTVGGREIKLDVDSVMRATKLPSGSVKVPTSCDKVGLRKILQGSESDLKTARGFNVGHLVHRDDMDCFQALAGMLMMKLEARRECFHFVTGEVLLALDRSLRDGLQMDWAEYLTRLMVKTTAITSKRVPSSSIGYQYGEWLTKVIENGMVNEAQLTVLASEVNLECNEREENDRPRSDMQPVTDSRVENWIVPFEDRGESGRMMEIQEENFRLQRELQEAELHILELELKREEGVGIIRDAVTWLKNKAF